MLIKRRTYHTRLLPYLLCLLSVLLSACSLFGGGDAQQARSTVKAPLNKQTYKIPIVGITDFSTLDPALADDPSSIKAIQMVYTGLVQLNDRLEVKPQLASSWHLENDGVSWTFHLKSNLKFNDGTPLTSADVAYSIDRALQPATRSTVAPLYLGLIKDADQLLAGHITTLINDSLLTPDKQTLVIVTRKKAAYFPAMLTSTCSFVVEQSLISKYGAQFTDHLNEGGGAGPFKVAQYTHRASIDFVPNTSYYNKQPQLQKVTFALYHSADEAYQDYKNKQLDMSGVPLSTFAHEKDNKDEFHQVPQLWTNYYAMNYLVKPFDNIHIRQAFALAIDKQAIVNDVWKNTVLPTNHIVPGNLADANADLKGPDGTTGLSGNAQKAKDLLQQGLREEGWNNVSQIPPITLTYVADIATFKQEVAALIQSWQSVLNVKVTGDPVDSQTLLDKVTAATSNPQGIPMWGLAWVDEYPDAQDWLSLQFGTGSVNNNMNYGQNVSKTAAQQQATQQQLDAADANTQDSQARLRAYQQAEQQIVNDVGWLPMEQVTDTFLRTPLIVGMQDNAKGLIPPDDWANIYRVQ